MLGLCFCPPRRYFPVLAILDGEADAPGKSETALRNGLPQLGLGGESAGAFSWLLTD